MKKSTSSGCLTIIIVMVINLTLGAWSVAEILSWFGKDIPLWADALIGLIAAEISLPVAIIGAILRYFGIF